MKLIAALLAALFLAFSAPAAAETAVERHGQLRVEGGRIVDQQGRPVMLRGMSLFWSQWQPQYYNASAIRWLRDDWNINVIRAAMAVHEDGYLKHPQREMKKVEAVIDAAIELGIYVIIDWHAHQPEPAAAGEFFARIAAKYGSRPNIIYETWNEPLREHDWSRVIKPYHEAVIPRIRAHDSDNLIVAGTQTWSQDVDKAAADPLRFSNVAYTLHFYAGTHRQELRDKATAAMKKGAAIFVTEWGTSEANGSGILDEKETRLWWDFMEKNQLSYLNWSVTDKPETSAALMPGASGKGGWPDRMLSPSGKLVRSQLRAMNPRREASGVAQPAAANALEMAITIDDLPVHGPLPPGETRLTVARQIISALKEAGVPSVYGFTNGAHLEGDPEVESVLSAWRGAGFPLANHTYSHVNLNSVSAADYQSDIVKNEPLLKRHSKGKEWRWFRYPFLAEGDDPAKRIEVRRFLGERRYRLAGVTMSYWDYEWNDAYARCRTSGDTASLARLEEAYLAAVKDSVDYWRRLSWAVHGRDIPYVLLTHISPFNARMFPRILAFYKQQGFRFVTLERATRHAAYRGDLNPSLPPPPNLERQAAERGQPLYRQDPAPMLAAVCR